MSDEVMIDGELMDINGPVSIDIRNMNISSPHEIAVSNTYTIQAPNSSRNRKLFGFSDDPATGTPGAYESKNVSHLMDGVASILNGRAILMDVSEDMNFNIVGRGVDFFKSIQDKSLRDLNLPNDSGGDNYTGQPSWCKYWACETFMDQVNYSAGATVGAFNSYFQTVNTQYLIPWVKKSAIMEQICTDAGYTFDFSVLNDIDDYSNSWVSMYNPEGMEPSYRQLIWLRHANGKYDARQLLHDVGQADFFKSVLLQYGAFPIVVGKSVWVGTFKYLQKLKAKGLDWSGKVDFTRRPTTSFDTGYRKSIEYKYSEYQNYQLGSLATMIYQNGTEVSDIKVEVGDLISSENLALDNDVDQREIVFEPTLEILTTTDEGLPRKIPYIPCYDPVGGTFKQNYGIQNIVVPQSATSYKRMSGSSEAWTITAGSGTWTDILKIPWFSTQESDASVVNSGDEYGLSFVERLLPQHYSYADTRFIRRPIKITAIMHLTLSDIHRYIDAGKFTSSSHELSVAPVYISELGGHYYVQEISGYTNGQPCRVVLIRL